jgi:hypothetical protein
MQRLRLRFRLRSRIIRLAPVLDTRGLVATITGSVHATSGAPDTGLGRHMPEPYGWGRVTQAIVITTDIGAAADSYT